MSTKSDDFVLKDKLQHFGNGSANIEYGKRYSNFHLNQNNKSSVSILVQSFSKPNHDKFYDTPTSSILSIRIAAYENFFEAKSFGGKNYEALKNSGSIKKDKNAKQICTLSAAAIKNPFEFTRQQNDKITDPEVSKFKASQRLLNSNHISFKVLAKCGYYPANQWPSFQNILSKIDNNKFRFFMLFKTVLPMFRFAVVLPRLLHTTPAVYRGFKPGRGTGDKGSSSLFNNERRWKDDEAFHALGNTDELSSFLGICREFSSDDCLEDVTELITRIQCILQDLGAHVATPPNSSKKKQERTVFDEKFVKYVDGLIDEYGDKTPSIRQFILPGGGSLGAHLQYARALCRRAERSLVPLVRDEAIDENALKFLNRLSDLLFVLGRYACLKTHNYELSYLPPLKNVEQEADVKATKLIDKKNEEI